MHGGKIFSKSGCFLSSLVLVLYLLSGILHSSAIREDIMSGTCRDLLKGTFEEPAKPGEPEEPVPNWTTRDDDKSCSICNARNDKKSWFYIDPFKTGSAKYIHVNITMQFADCTDCRNQNIKAFVLKEKLPDKVNEDLVYQKLNNLTIVKNIKVVEPGKRRTHYFQYYPDSKSISSGDSLVFLGEGACAIIYKIKVWTFYCKKTTIKGVPLPKTASPAFGSLRVNSSCPSNTVPQGSEVFGLCSNDGEWDDSRLTPCLCPERFTLGENGCEGCEKNTYKPDVGNGNCTSCPLNAESAPKEVRCECKDGFYRFVGDNDHNPCYGKVPGEILRECPENLSEEACQILLLRADEPGTPQIFLFSTA